MAVTKYIIAIEIKNTPVGVKNVPCTTMSPKKRSLYLYAFSNDYVKNCTSITRIRLYLPMMEKKDAVIRNAYKTLMMAAIVIWVFALVAKQMMM